VPRAQFPRKPALIQTVRILSLRKEGAAWPSCSLTHLHHGFRLAKCFAFCFGNTENLLICPSGILLMCFPPPQMHSNIFMLLIKY
jgi:hypothetical protein